VALATLGANLFWRGQDVEASVILEQVVEPTHPPTNKIYSSWALGCLAAISARRGDLESCERRLQQATDLATRHRGGGHWMTAIAVLTSADLLAGRGELAEAEEAALSALERAERGRARIETACALLWVARISSQAGNTDDAHVRIRQARELIGKCAAPGVLTGLLTATQDMAAGQHPATPGSRQRSRVPRPDGLTGRQAQVLELLADGDTNNEIAAELVISIHTVERHLQNAYRKIGVRNRADAAAYIVRAALNTPESP
jgi:LuxR family maltose regulon positive regulatory protein